MTGKGGGWVTFWNGVGDNETKKWSWKSEKKFLVELRKKKLLGSIMKYDK